MRNHSHGRSAENGTRAGRPTRSAAQNRELVDRADPETEASLLPALDDGIVLLDHDNSRGVPVLQSLVLDHLLLHDGPAFWVDADGHATTTGLARIAPSQRLLDRIHVARGFTPYQHYSAVCDLSEAVNCHVRAATDSTPSGATGRRAPQTPSLVVAPALDARYRGDETLSDRHARTLQARSLARLRTYAESYNVPVLVTRTAVDAFTAPIETAADLHLECEQTRLGPRFVGEEFETLVYPVDDGSSYQTTLAYWRQLLGARAEHVGLEPSPSTQPNSSEGAIGTSATASGQTASFTADPVLDAWAGAGEVGGR